MITRFRSKNGADPLNSPFQKIFDTDHITFGIGAFQVKIKAMLGMLGGGENIYGWLFMMELLPLEYHCMRT